MSINRGFTLLEFVLALLLFSILMTTLGQIFNQMYRRYVEYEQRSYLMDNSRAVRDFIQDEIRKSDAVKLSLDNNVLIDSNGDGKLYNDEVVIVNPSETSAVGGSLVRITLNSGGQLKTIFLKSNPSYMTQVGKFQLIYEANGKENLISNQIECINIYREMGSELIFFECVLCKAGETLKRLQLNNVFAESMAYKEKIS